MRSLVVAAVAVAAVAEHMLMDEVNWQTLRATPVPSHPGVKLPATPAPPEPSITHSCECPRAEKWALTSIRTECDKHSEITAKIEFQSVMTLSMNEAEEPQLSPWTAGTSTSLHERRNVNHRQTVF